MYDNQIQTRPSSISEQGAGKIVKQSSPIKYLMIIPSSSSNRERSKFPEGLKATETETGLGRRCKCETGREAAESKVGLQEIHAEGEGMACFKEGESGIKGLMAVMGVASLWCLVALRSSFSYPSTGHFIVWTIASIIYYAFLQIL